jgi:hypothetical protein
VTRLPDEGQGTSFAQARPTGSTETEDPVPTGLVRGSSGAEQAQPTAAQAALIAMSIRA